MPVGISARHIHLSLEHMEMLFGKGHKLTPIKELMGGQYAAQETLTLAAIGGSIEKVRVLGPLRKKSQVEVSATDARSLGITPPVRESGDLSGSAPITLLGPKGTVHLSEGCIIAKRHIHLPPGQGYKDGDLVSVRIQGSRGLIFDNIKIRVDPTFTPEMHIDTDEANACGIKNFERAVIICSSAGSQDA